MKPSRKKPTVAPLLPILLIISFVGIFPRNGLALKSSEINSRNNDRGRLFHRRQHEFPARPAALTQLFLMSSSVSLDSANQQDGLNELFPTHRPLLAIITEPTSCDSEEKMKHTYAMVEKAALTGKVDLVNVRLSLPPRYDENGDESNSYRQVWERACWLTKKFVELSTKQQKPSQSQDYENDRNDCAGTHQNRSSYRSFTVVCSSDLVSVAVNARANGIHVKEHHLDQLADIVHRFNYPIVIGTSTHSIESALKSYFVDEGCNDSVMSNLEDEALNGSCITRQRPDYYFVGTCYMTASHPEKTLQSQLEGPGLPGKVKRALWEKLNSNRQSMISLKKASSEDYSSMESLQLRLPRIMAIGGIDETNCHEPVALGADGVAVIRAVLQAEYPIERVEEMQNNMMEAYTSITIE